MNVSDTCKMAAEYNTLCNAFLKEGFIKKLSDDKDHVVSEKSKNLSINLKGLEEFTYTAIMRELRKQANKEQILFFLKAFKNYFDSAVDKDLDSPAKIALQKTIVDFAKQYKIILNKKIIKNAVTTELGDAELVGKYLSDIVKFTLGRISPEKRPGSLNKMKGKIYYLNENELAAKKMPASASMGQSITFVKHVLFNHDPKYIRRVLNSLVRYL